MLSPHVGVYYLQRLRSKDMRTIRHVWQFQKKRLEQKTPSTKCSILQYVCIPSVEAEINKPALLSSVKLSCCLVLHVNNTAPHMDCMHTIYDNIPPNHHFPYLLGEPTNHNISCTTEGYIHSSPSSARFASDSANLEEGRKKKSKTGLHQMMAATAPSLRVSLRDCTIALPPTTHPTARECRVG